MTELPDNIDLRWLGRHLLDFHEEMRRELASMRTDVDRHTVLLRRLDEEAIVTGAALVRIERRIEKLEESRAGASPSST
jgi:hypothetical protein